VKSPECMEARDMSVAKRLSGEAARERGKAELALELAKFAHPSVRGALMATAQYHRHEASRHEYHSMMARLDADPETSVPA
jgi:hypothetical protein